MEITLTILIPECSSWQYGPKQKLPSTPQEQKKRFRSISPLKHAQAILKCFQNRSRKEQVHTC